MANTIQLKRGDAADWTAANPTLAAGEFGFEADTGKFKVGNGSDAWSALGYFAPAAAVFSPALAFTLDNPNPYSTSAVDYFGWSVSVSGNYAIVGAQQEDDAGGLNSGKAYIYNVTTGALIYTLDNPNPASNASFGYSVAVSGDYAIVSAYRAPDAGGTDSGKAYIYNVTTGSLVHTLNNPSAYGTSAGDQFGTSVSVSGDYAIVGAQFEDDGNTSSGKAYIYNVTTGGLLYTLNNPNAYGTSADDRYGYSVAISSDYAIVGVPLEEDAGGTLSGKAYVYNLTTGALVHTLNNPNAYGTSATDFFGYSVAISSDYAIVGSRLEDDAGSTDSGKVYIYNVTTGALVYTLDNPNGNNTSAGSGDEFGYSVSISGNYVIVGAKSEDDAGGTDSGKAYIFDVTTGALVYTLDNPSAYGTSAGDQFGYSVSISDNYAIVSANEEDDAGGGASGKAYIYSLYA